MVKEWVNETTNLFEESSLIFFLLVIMLYLYIYIYIIIKNESVISYPIL